MTINEPCPHPHKKGYDRKSKALLAADHVRWDASVYECRCGRWHLTSMGSRQDTWKRMRGTKRSKR